MTDSRRDRSSSHKFGSTAGHKLVVEPRGFLIRFFGKLSSEELRHTAAFRQAEPEFGEISYVLNDFEECPEVTVDIDEMEYLAANDWAASRSHRSPLVVLLWPDRPDIRALASAYLAAQVSPWEVRVFANEEAARRWLLDAGLTR